MWYDEVVEIGIRRGCRQEIGKVRIDILFVSSGMLNGLNVPEISHGVDSIEF